MHHLSAAKKVLLSVMVVGGLSFFTLASTFAVFNSGTANNGNSVSSGTLTLGNQVESASMCFSYSSTANTNTGCDPLLSSSTLQYPGTTATIHVTLKNVGTVKGSAMAIYMPSCTTVTSPSAPSPGGANMCTAADPRLSIAESDSTWTSTNCVYPQPSGATCSLVANSFKTFASTYTSSGHVLTIDSATHVAVAGSTGLAGGGYRYFVITLQLPSTTANTLQGEEALFNLTWNLTQ